MNKSRAQHQHVDRSALSTNVDERVAAVTVLDVGLATSSEERAMPSLDQGGEQLQSVQSVGMVVEDPALSATVVDTGLATDCMEGAVPSLGKQQHQHQHVARNRKAVPTPMKPKKVERKGDYHLNWWNLWWLRMEREGGKEEKERRIVRMQKPANLFFALKEKEKPSMVEDGRPPQDFDMISIEPVVARSTPLKRKCDLWTDLENISDISTVESPAKRQRNNFNVLLKFWDGVGGGGQEQQQLKNEPQKPIIHSKDSNLQISEDNARTQRKAEPKLDTATHNGGSGGDSESGLEVDADWSGGGG